MNYIDTIKMNKMDKIRNISDTKKSKIILSADLTNKNKLLELLDQVGPYIMGVKMHADIITDIDETFIDDLVELKKKHNFIIIEDRKFADIGNIVQLQSKYITQYADLITVHAICGQSIIDGLRENCVNNDCCILLIAQMSTENNLIDQHYIKHTVGLAQNNRDVVIGFICQEKLADDFLHFTPGVNISTKSDNLGQTYQSPSHLLDNKKVDYLIVGRGIYESNDPILSAKLYMDDNLYLLHKLKQLNIIKKGNFTLKSGEKSQIYADFRLLMEHPSILNQVCDKLIKLINNSDGVAIVGVPMGGLQFSFLISQKLNIPHMMIRSERKKYGQGNIIEGVQKKYDVIIIEDVITTGSSVTETINKLKEENIKVNQIICVLDRDIGVSALINDGYNVKSLFKMSDL